VVEDPPFEITETGWGEFDIGIRIYFVDQAEKPVDLVHSLRLYHADNTPLSTKKPVVSEVYDEIVFNEPSESFHKKLTRGASSSSSASSSPSSPPARTSLPHPLLANEPSAPIFCEKTELKKINDANKKVKAQILQTQEQHDKILQEIQQIKKELEQFKE